MRPFLIVALDPAIKIDLEIGDRAVDLLAKGDAIELIEHRLVEPLDDAISHVLGHAAFISPPCARSCWATVLGGSKYNPAIHGSLIDLLCSPQWPLCEVFQSRCFHWDQNL